MLKRPITYKDADENEITETFYFNLTKSELVEMESSRTGGYGEFLQQIINADNQNKLIFLFKDIILAAYGKRSDDGKAFIKNQQLRDEFAQSFAYDALFMELATQEGKAVDFVKGIIPSDMNQELEMSLKTAALQAKQAETIPPPPSAQ
jgi:hypothetical protein